MLPVSYTHLDVYKRQLLVGVERIPSHTASQGTPGFFPLVEGTGVGDGGILFIAVSYTHLDIVIGGQGDADDLLLGGEGFARAADAQTKACLLYTSEAYYYVTDAAQLENVIREVQSISSINWNRCV